MAALNITVPRILQFDFFQFVIPSENIQKQSILEFQSKFFSILKIEIYFNFSQLTAVSAFAQTLRRYTSLNHLAQAARAVLQNSSQINQMLADLNRVDFHNVQEQVKY